MANANTGVTNTKRVISRCVHKGIHSLIKPSIITHPAEVPVIVELWPEDK